VPQQTPTGAASAESDIVKTIAALYASQADKEAEALYQQTSIGMSARERLKLSHFIEEEIRRIHVAQPSSTNARSLTGWTAVEQRTSETLHTPTWSLFDRLWDSSTETRNSAGWTAVEEKTYDPLHTPTLNVFDRWWHSLVDGLSTLLEGGVTLLYFAFWIALAIVVFYTACRIIGF